MFKKYLWLVVAVVALLPAPSEADWLLTPMATYPFGADTPGNGDPGFGVAVGWVDDEAFGVEVDLGLAPRFFNGGDGGFAGTGSVTTVVGNILVGMPHRRAWPYVSAGGGYFRMHVTSPDGFDTTTTEPGVDAGAGIVASIGPRVGIRGDLRYFLSLRDLPPTWTSGTNLDIAPGHFDFWRAAVGVTIRLPD